MHMSRNILTIAIIFCLFSLSCVSKKHYLELESNLISTRKQLEKETENLNGTSDALSKTEKSLKECQESLENTKSLYEIVEEQNSKLDQKVNNVHAELEKTKSINKNAIHKLDDTKNAIESALKDEIANQEARIIESEGKLKVVLIDKFLFESKSIKISKKGKSTLLKIADPLKTCSSNDIIIESHSDNLPVSSFFKKYFSTNWELCSAKAASVVHFLQEKGKIIPEKLSAAGYSYYRPAVQNDTEEGRRQNSRIEVVLIPPKQNL